MLPLYYYNKVEIASVFHIHTCRMLKTCCSLHRHPRRGRACPARELSHNHPLIFRIVGRGLDPSAARRGRRSLQRWPETIPAPIHARGGLRAGRPTIFRSPHRRGGIHPSRAAPGCAPPNHSLRRGGIYAARNLPTACRQSSTAHHPHNLCPPTPITPIYTLPKLPPQTLSKKSKKLAKTC